MFRRGARPLGHRVWLRALLSGHHDTSHAQAHTDTHAHAMRCKLQSQCWTQGRCCRRHRVSVSAAAGTGSQAQGKQACAACSCAPYDEDTTTHAQAHTDTHAHSMRYELQSVVLDARAPLQAAPCQCQCGSRNRLLGTGKQANAACACHVPVVWPWVVYMDRSHLSTARMEVNDKQCTRTMETGRARPRLVSIHDRTRMCTVIGEATATCRQRQHR